MTQDTPLSWSYIGGERTPFKTSWLKPLTNNPHSPFYHIKCEALLAILEECRAEFAETDPHSGKRGDTLEGRLLFQQHSPQSHVYLPIKGAIIGFEARGRQVDRIKTPDIQSPQSTLTTSKHVTKDRHRLLSALIGSPVHLRDLAGFEYGLTISPGEFCGLGGFYLCFLKAISEGRVTSTKSLSERREALSQSHVVDLAGSWVLSGFASNNARIIRVSIANLIRLMDDFKKWGDTVGWIEEPSNENPNGEPVFKYTKIIRRICEETVIRQTKRLFKQTLIGRNRHDVLLAIHLYEHFQRKGKSSVGGSRARMAWYMNLNDPDKVRDHIANFPVEHFCAVTLDPNADPIFGTNYEFDSEWMLRYYQTYIRMTTEGEQPP